MKRKMSVSESPRWLRCSTTKRLPSNRRGAVTVLAAVLLVVLMSMAAFAIDLGYMARTKTELQNAADGASLAAAIELTDGLGLAPTKSTSAVTSSANTAATTVAALQRNGDLSSTLLSSSRDVRYGKLNWDAGTQKWIKTWGVAPYNLVEATARRDQPLGTGPASADSRLRLLFAPTIGIKDAALTSVAAAALYPGVGIHIIPNSGLTAGVLPIAMDDPTWTALCAGTGTDNYRYDPSTGTVTSGTDGINEVSLYPVGNGSPGNRGTVNIGTSNNSTANLQRQIEFGLNESDLAPYGGALRTDNGPLSLSGNPGISAAIKSSLSTIIGKPRLIPVFTALSGNGANAKYTITKFVGVRVMYVQLTGGNKTVVIQPAPFSSFSVIPGKTTVAVDSYFTKPRLAE